MAGDAKPATQGGIGAAVIGLSLGLEHPQDLSDDLTRAPG